MSHMAWFCVSYLIHFNAKHKVGKKVLVVGKK
ncbi:hypothetical protein D046_2268A, partial [Vibrio parahaemolyticus V-223/04]